ncbi:uncharacterized protein LOC141679267 [Apium graveolens]|uniref:uncharacterized protein LOC141679267 n=1 Tax=Apium graveolens TaxID=4045 RepID=UPI003D7BA51B
MVCRNKKVRENKSVTPIIAMDWSAKTISDWREAKAERYKLNMVQCVRVQVQGGWKMPESGVLKLNVDVAVKLGSPSFSMKLIIRDHTGSFVAAKTVCTSMVSTVFEAEALAILEGLQWLLSMNHTRVTIESDSMLAVRALQGVQENLLEVGHVLNACRTILDSNSGYSISWVKRQANRVAHLLAKMPCSLHCQNIVTVPSDLLLESLVCDVS